MAHSVVLHLGSNLGDRSSYLHYAFEEIGQKIGEINKYSKIYNTEAWGKSDQPDYLNAAVVLETELDPHSIIERSKKIEHEAGTIEKKKWAERKLDIDLLFYDDSIIQTDELRVPHPFIHKRNFVLVPLMDIIPNFVHPQLKRTIEELMLSCKDTLDVTYHSEVHGYD